MKNPRHVFWTLSLIIVMILSACGGGDEDSEKPSPTPPALGNLTPEATSPGVATVTPLPTSSNNLFLSPTPIQFTPPTQIAAAPTQPFVNNIDITSPTNGSILRGTMAILGSASHPEFLQYALEYGPDPNSGNLWYPITSVPITTVVINNVLGGWNTTSVADGNYQLRLHVWMRNGVEDFRTIRVQVQNTQAPTSASINSNPTISPIGPVSLVQGNSVTIALGMSDIDNDPLTYLAQVMAPSIATVTPAGSSAITVNGITPGTTTVSISVSDQRGGVANTSFTVTVSPPASTNNPPSISPLAAQSLNTGESRNLTVIAADPDPGDMITLTATSTAPAILGVGLTGNILTLTGVSQGSASVNITATDTKGLSTTVSFLATVITPAPANQPPSILPISAQTLDTGAILNVTFSASDPDNDPLTVTASSSNSGVATGFVVDPVTVRLNGVAGGTAAITLMVSDNKGGTASTSFNVTVNAPAPSNQAPTLGAITDQTVDVGGTVDVAASASDPDGDQVTVSATSSANGIATASVNGTTITVSGVAAGSAQITVTASDGVLSSTPVVFNVTVNQAVVNNPPSIAPISDIAVNAGAASTVTATTSDPDGDTVTIAATSSNTGVATVSVAGNNITVNGVSVGSSVITVTPEDGQVEGASISFNVTVNAPAPVNNPPTVAPIANVTVLVGGTSGVNAVTSDPDGDTVSITATSANPAVATVSVAGSTITVTGVSAGTAAVTVTPNDGTVNGTPVNFNVTVNAPAPVNNPPTVAPIADMTITTGATSDVTAVTSDPDGDSVTINADTSNPGVAIISVTGNIITVNGVAAGAAVITVTPNDGTVDGAPVSFNVTVNDAVPVNTPPSVTGPADASVEAGASTTVTLTTSDPDSEQVTLNAVSSDTNIATVAVAGSDLTISGVSAGSASITITPNDGTVDGTPITLNVTVTAAAPVNSPPTVEQIGEQTVVAGASTTVTTSLFDPDGDTVTITASAADGAIATASALGADITITGVAAGTTTVTVVPNDGTVDGAPMTFSVVVSAPAPVNNPPSVDALLDATLETGQTITVTATTSDPEGDSVTLAAISDNAAVASVGVAGNDISITGNGVGTAFITVTPNDGTVDGTPVSFTVTVNAPAPVNNPPTAEQPGIEATVAVGATTVVTITTSDPDGDTVTITAVSGDTNIATTSVAGNDITLTGIGVGTTTITVTPNDGTVDGTPVSFPVNVNTPAPTFDITAYPEMPEVHQSMVDIYNNGQANGKRNSVFSVAGDGPVNSPDFLPVPPYNLGNFGGLQGIIDFYNATAAHESVGDPATSFGVQSAATGDGWTLATLFDASQSPGYCNGQAPLACELNVAAPSVIFISFSYNGAVNTGFEQFGGLLRQAVELSLGAGTVPILTTIPDDGSTDPNLLMQFNEAIVLVKNDYNVPMWNLYLTMQSAPSGVYAVGGANSADFTDPALNAGVNRRNWAAIRSLVTVKQGLGF